MTDRPILVVGATGKTGSRVAAGLAARGRAVRPGARSAALPFDWTRPGTWAPALEGVEAAYVAYHPDIAVPGAVETVAAFVEQARRSGLGRLVLLTGRGERHARRAEEIAQASGLGVTVLRAAWFAQNFSEGELADPVRAGVLPMPGGDVREPILDIDDLAEIAVEALLDPRHAGELYELTGPRLMTFDEMAADIAAAAGRPVQRLSLSFDAFHDEVARAHGGALAEVVTAVARETLDGRNAWLGDGVQRALGRAPRDFADFARAAAEAGAWRVAA
ncbi:SDR family oxidoreductase [Albimonas pacifica]|uniref:Uncharacterized conserved protein YbjT, contains NAD(P)-binding and DUF2867 domains n=1 Tax=Albimonas pacifica TaxID=1114924 RepID=A0A1I3K3F9_9RHOB|nr:NmrA family transcriptional regulator [Albimonas pacifica]SFI66735.1 Uncharacterized conserved protein YbjT, contains NAD(P)-binding and DUF2867 domains [Albimonas pacifica]